MIKSYLAKRGLTANDIFNYGGLVLYKGSWYGDEGPLTNTLASPLLYKKKRYEDLGIIGSVFLPVENLFGDIIGFTIRNMSQDFPQDSFFLYNEHKKNNLFGLNRTYKHIYDKNKVYIVEGQFDFMKLYTAGIHNVVSPMGTAFTENHAFLLRMFTDNLCVVFDNDRAGITKREKLCHTYSPFFTVTYKELDKDPDEFVTDYGVDKFFEVPEVKFLNV